MMGAWLEGYVEGARPGLTTGGPQCGDFGVRPPGRSRGPGEPLVRTVGVRQHDRPHPWIRRGPSSHTFSASEAAPHSFRILAAVRIRGIGQDESPATAPTAAPRMSTTASNGWGRPKTAEPDTNTLAPDRAASTTVCSSM